MVFVHRDDLALGLLGFQTRHHQDMGNEKKPEIARLLNCIVNCLYQ